MNPRISFVICTFNDDPAHLRQAIASAATRSVLPEETIVVDNESTRTNLLEFPGTTEKGTQVIYQPHGGPSSAWDAGVTRATSGYVITLDAMIGWPLTPWRKLSMFSLEAAFLRLEGMHALHLEYRSSAHK